MFVFCAQHTSPGRLAPANTPGTRNWRWRLAGAGAVVAGAAAVAAFPGSAATAAPAISGAPAAPAISGAPAAPAISGAPAAAAAAAGPAYAWTRTILVTRLRDGGPGSLRAAITAANASAPGQATRIRFRVRGVITLASALPAIARPVTIDGTSAPGYRRARRPVLELDAGGHAGLLLAGGSAGSQVLGLALDDAAGDGITLLAGWITLNHDYIGLDPAGAADGNGGAGVYAAPTSQRDRIGLNPAAIPGAVGNVISGNGGSGIVLSGSSYDTVAANRIGTNPAGTASIGNGGDGITLTEAASGNELGGTAYTNPLTGAANNPTGSEGTTTPVFVVPALGNLISGNAGNGVLIEAGSTANMLNGNFIGTTASGQAGLGNGRNGVWIYRAAGNSLVGCKFVNNPFVYYNVISGNDENGLRVTSSDNVTVQGNFFGVGADNSTVLGNRLDGVLVDGSARNTQVGGVIPLGNVSAGNGQNGIEVAGRARGFLTFNTFGGLLAFKGAAPNGNDGLLITSTGGNNEARTNVFSGNRNNGIEIAGNASGVTVEPNIAGLTTEGNAALPNGGDGLLISGTAHGNVIGGTLRSVIPQNTFSGNVGYGVVITGGAYRNRVFDSFIGTNVLGIQALGNGRGGVLLSGVARRNLIGAPRPAPVNLISGNTGTGVTLTPGTSRNWVLSNYLGLDRFGRRLPNTGRPVANFGRHNVIAANRS